MTYVAATTTCLNELGAGVVPGNPSHPDHRRNHVMQHNAIKPTRGTAHPIDACSRGPPRWMRRTYPSGSFCTHHATTMGTWKPNKKQEAIFHANAGKCTPIYANGPERNKSLTAGHAHDFQTQLHRTCAADKVAGGLPRDTPLKFCPLASLPPTVPDRSARKMLVGIRQTVSIFDLRSQSDFQQEPTRMSQRSNGTTPEFDRNVMPPYHLAQRPARSLLARSPQ